MTQKVLKVGTSAAVTIPKASLKELGLKIGDKVTVEIDKKKKSVTIKAADQISQELLDWTDKFIEEYKPALKALSKK
jgi:putative addiction module antidote